MARCIALVLLGLVALASAQEQVDSIVDSISSFIENIEDAKTGRDLQGWKHRYVSTHRSGCTSGSCGVASPPPSPAYPPPCQACTARPASPPPVVACPPPPSPVTTGCPTCSKPPVTTPVCSPPKVTVPVCSPPKVATPSPCKTPSPVATPSPCKTPSPVATPSPCAVPSPKPVSTPSPSKGAWCGWKTTKSKWGKKRWSKHHCSRSEKCCKIPVSWGGKTKGPKCAKSVKTTLKCCKGSCPKYW